LTTDWIKNRCIDFTFVGNEFLPNSQAISKLTSSRVDSSKHGKNISTSASTQVPKSTQIEYVNAAIISNFLDVANPGLFRYLQGSSLLHKNSHHEHEQR